MKCRGSPSLSLPWLKQRSTVGSRSSARSGLRTSMSWDTILGGTKGSLPMSASNEGQVRYGILFELEIEKAYLKQLRASSGMARFPTNPRPPDNRQFMEAL